MYLTRRTRRKQILSNAFPHYRDGYGIFQQMTNPPWGSEFPALQLDILYMSRSGNKYISNLVKTVLDNNGEVPDEYVQTISTALLVKYRKSWERLYATESTQYNVFNPYHITESEEEEGETGVESTEQRSGTNSETNNTSAQATGTNTDASAIYGFNTTTGKNDRSVQSNDSSTSTGTQTKSGQSTDTNSVDRTDTSSKTRNLTRQGSLGYKTGAEIIKEERSLWREKYLDTIFNDLDSALTIPIYDSHRYCDESEYVTPSQPTITIPKATDTQLGGVKAADKTNTDTIPVNIDSSGHLWVSPSGESFEVVDFTSSEFHWAGTEEASSEIITYDTSLVKRIQNSKSFFVRATIPESDTSDRFFEVIFYVKRRVYNGVVYTFSGSQLDYHNNIVYLIALPVGSYIRFNFKRKTEYELPVASTELGGVKANTKQSTDTKPVRVDSSGYLWTEPDESESIPVLELTYTISWVAPQSATISLPTNPTLYREIAESEYFQLNLTLNNSQGYPETRTAMAYMVAQTQSSVAGYRTFKAAYPEYDGVVAYAIVDIEAYGTGTCYISVQAPTTQYTLPVASTELGGVKAPSKTSSQTQSVGVDANGYLWTESGSQYTLPVASTDLGGVKAPSKTAAQTQSVGVDSNGYLWTEPGSGSSYVLPIAGQTLGGVVADDVAGESNPVAVDYTSGRMYVNNDFSVVGPLVDVRNMSVNDSRDYAFGNIGYNKEVFFVMLVTPMIIQYFNGIPESHIFLNGSCYIDRNEKGDVIGQYQFVVNMTTDTVRVTRIA